MYTYTMQEQGDILGQIWPPKAHCDHAFSLLRSPANPPNPRASESGVQNQGVQRSICDKSQNIQVSLALHRH